MKITKEEYDALKKIKPAYKHHWNLVKMLVDSAKNITKEKETEYTKDMICGYMSIDEGLSRMGIEVEDNE